MQGGLNYQKTLKHFSGLGSGYAIEWNEMDNNIGFLDVYMGKTWCPLNILIYLYSYNSYLRVSGHVRW